MPYRLVAIHSAMSLLGQLGGGLLADRYGIIEAPLQPRPMGTQMTPALAGPLNTLTCSTLLGAVATFAWPFAINGATFVVVAVLSGSVTYILDQTLHFRLMSLYPGCRIASGGFHAFSMQPFQRMGRLADMGLRVGMSTTLSTAPVVAGPPLLGAIFDATGSYKNVGYCGGDSVPIPSPYTPIEYLFRTQVRY